MWTEIAIDCYKRTSCKGCFFDTFFSPDGTGCQMKKSVKKLVLEFGSPDEIQEMAEKKENLYAKIRELLNEKPMTAYEVAEELNILAGSARYYLQNMTRSGKVLTQIIKVKNQKQVIYQLKKKKKVRKQWQNQK